MKYRITTRGWIVFSALGILLIASILSLFNPFTDSPVDQSQLDPISESTEEVNNNESSDDGQDQTQEAVTEETETPTEVVEEDSSEEATSSETQEETDEVVVDLSKESTILFEKNTADLEAEFLSVLDEWIELLKDNDYTITVEGHINGYPYYEDGNYGLTIAENRALVVKNYLIDNGMKSERIMIVNMGSNKQVSREKDFHLNRRAVIYFNEKP